MPNSWICVDANLVVRLVAGQKNDAFRLIWQQWRVEQHQLIAPVLFRFEVTNALYRLHRHGGRDAEDMMVALRAALELPIRMYDGADLHQATFNFAARFRLGAAYDAHYLALADRVGAELWTADTKLFNSVRHALPWVLLVPPEPPISPQEQQEAPG